jgi:hypothetical protein
VAARREDVVFPAVDYAVMRKSYEGYARAINELANTVLALDADANIVIAGSDDVWPDPDRDPISLEREFLEHFNGTFGVLQCQGHSDWSKLALEVAWSPWLGRAWCSEAYGGRGPLWPGYHHMFVDAELKLVAEKEGVYWERHDIRQFHDTWKRRIPRPPRPPHLMEAHRRHPLDHALFEARKAAGFPA